MDKEPLETSTQILRRSAEPLNAKSSSVDDVIAAVEAIVGMPARDLVMEFESLGPACEFGFVQRLCGAEPISFTRFTRISREDMIRGLDVGFADVNNPEHLELHGDMTNGWDVHVPRYGMAYHTFRRGIEREVMHSVEPDRMRFRRDKFLAELSRGLKIFLTWRWPVPGSPQLTLADIEPLLAAVRRYGSGYVMWLVESSSGPFVEELRPGLLRGHIGKLRDSGAEMDPDFAGWMTVLVNAWLLRQTGNSPS